MIEMKMLWNRAKKGSCVFGTAEVSCVWYDGDVKESKSVQISLKQAKINIIQYVKVV